MKRFFSHLPRQREHQRDRVLRGGDRIAERRVHHDDAARRGGGNVDVVDADAGAADHFEPRGAFEQFRCHLGRRSDREAVIIADDPGEFLFVEAGLHVDLDAAFLEDRDGGGREFVGDENAGCHQMTSEIPFSRLREKVARSAG